MEIKKINILNSTVESMMSDAEDRGDETFGITLSLEDAKTICKALNLLEKNMKTELTAEADRSKPTPIWSPLADTVEGMLHPDYKERFKAEYHQTKIRYEKLKAFCNKIEAAQRTQSNPFAPKNVEEPKHDCPVELLREQQSAMGQYLHTLEIRAVIEDVDLC